jgi:hypothetical protein
VDPFSYNGSLDVGRIMLNWPYGGGLFYGWMHWRGSLYLLFIAIYGIVLTVVTWIISYCSNRLFSFLATKPNLTGRCTKPVTRSEEFGLPWLVPIQLHSARSLRYCGIAASWFVRRVLPQTVLMSYGQCFYDLIWFDGLDRLILTKLNFSYLLYNFNLYFVSLHILLEFPSFRHIPRTAQDGDPGWTGDNILGIHRESKRA